jgi:muconolactone D-isomerase
VVEGGRSRLGATEAGKAVAIYKVSGQRRVIGVLDVGSADELGQIIVAGLPIAQRLGIVEVLPVREYAAFAEDLRQRRSATTS